jgi:hypothetical protein
MKTGDFLKYPDGQKVVIKRHRNNALETKRKK